MQEHRIPVSEWLPDIPYVAAQPRRAPMGGRAGVESLPWRV